MVDHLSGRDTHKSSFVFSPDCYFTRGEEGGGAQTGPEAQTDDNKSGDTSVRRGFVLSVKSLFPTPSLFTN